MRYYSSPFTFILKYILPVITLLIGFGTLIIMDSFIVDSHIIYAVGVALIWISIFMVQVPFFLRKVEANHKGLIIESKNETAVISFENVNSVSIFDFSNPWMVTIRYKESNTEKDCKISYMPNSKYQRIMKLDKMTEFIIDQSKSHNPDFKKIGVVRNVIILALAGLPFIIAILFLIKDVSINY